MRGNFTPAEGAAALDAWIRDSAAVSAAETVTAVRFTLGQLAQRAPGRSVEVRVPPAGAVQILGGTTHRRGTPPAIVEMSMTTWLELATGSLQWDEGEATGQIDASGERADLSEVLPLNLPAR